MNHGLVDPGVVIQGFVGLFWTLVYVEVAWRGVRERTYGMPLVALGANITWEFYWTFVERPPGTTRLMSYAQSTVDCVWLLVDAVILWTLLRNGRREFPMLSAWGVRALVAVALLTTGTVEVILNRDFDGRLVVCVAFGQNLMMSALFLAMLYSRGSLRGQSVTIAANKLAGTVLASVGVAFFAPPQLFTDTLLLPVMYVATFVLDLMYLLAVLRLARRSPADVPPPARTAPAAG